MTPRWSETGPSRARCPQPHNTLPKARSSVHLPTFRATRGDSAQGFVVTESLWGPPARPGATGRAQVRSLRHPSDSMLRPHTRGRHAGPCAAAGADPQETAPTPAEPTPPHASPRTPHGSQPPGPGGQVTGGNVTDSRRCRRPTLRPPGDSGPTTDAERGGTAGAPASCRAASHKEGSWGDPVFTHKQCRIPRQPPTHRPSTASPRAGRGPSPRSGKSEPGGHVGHKMDVFLAGGRPVFTAGSVTWPAAPRSRTHPGGSALKAGWEPGRLGLTDHWGCGCGRRTWKRCPPSWEQKRDCWARETGHTRQRGARGDPDTTTGR